MVTSSSVLVIVMNVLVVLVVMVEMVEMTKTTSRLAGEFSCLQPAAGTLLTKCSRFLRFFYCSNAPLFVFCCSISFCVCPSRQELPKDFGILCDFDREDFETFQVL